MVNIYLYKKVSNNPQPVDYCDLKDWTICFAEDETWNSSSNGFARQFNDRCKLEYFKDTRYGRPTNITELKKWLGNLRLVDIDVIEKYDNLLNRIEQDDSLYLVIST